MKVLTRFKKKCKLKQWLSKGGHFIGECQLRVDRCYGQELTGECAFLHESKYYFKSYHGCLAIEDFVIDIVSLINKCSCDRLRCYLVGDTRVIEDQWGEFEDNVGVRPQELGYG